MNPPWRDIEDYFHHTLVPHDPALEAAYAAGRAAGLPMHGSVSAAQGRLLELLVRVQGATRVLELGTLGGYSTLWLARGLTTGGRIITCELHQQRARLARANIAAAGLTHAIEVKIGPAETTLREMITERTQLFDLIFIDADKPNNATYLELGLALSRSGTVIVIDNMVRGGRILDPDPDASCRGVQDAVSVLADTPQAHTAVVQTVGAKGHDGFALIFVDEGGRHPLAGRVPA